MRSDADFAQYKRYLYGLADLQPEAIKALFLAADSSGCAWYRGKQPANRINQNFSKRVNQVVSTFMITPDEHPGPEDPRWDIVIHQRQNDINNLIWAERLTRSINPVHLYEIDDDLHHIDPSSPAYAYFTTERKKNTFRYMAAMDAMTVSTEPLKQLYAPYAKRIEVIPNVIEYEIVDQIPAPEPHDDIRIGWFGTHTHLVDLKIVFPVIEDILKKYKNVKFVMGGWDNCPLLKDLPADQVIIKAWTDNMMEHYTNLKSVDIAVVPLADIKFNESKSNLKFLEFGSLGVPVIASDVLPYSGTVRDGVNGYLVKSRGATYKAWLKLIEALINDADLRKKIGKTAASSIRAKYDQPKVAEKWVQFYEQILLDKRNRK